tara:strand:+ start:3570 stop:4493 length:924 start_codon:yes stop_codon:yes gene_type:complete
MATDKNVAELEDDFEIEIEDDTPEVDRGREPMPEDIVKSLDDDELENFSKEKAKQLKKVWHDERRAKEAALREREEAVGLLRRFAEENKTLKKNLHNGEQAYVGTAKVAFEKELESAKRDYKEAYDSGDADRVLDAQEKLFNAKHKLQQVENYRPHYNEEETALQEDFNGVDSSNRDGWSATPVDNTNPQPDPKAAAWQKRNPWFGENRVMTSMAFGLHEDLVGEGVDPTSDAYYARIDKEMRRRFPESFEGNDRKRPGTVVASAKRSTAPRKVTLTATQVSLARKLGLTPEQYAKEMIKLNGDTNG